jgi:DNA-binding HxlR family transcriptional regulator
VRELSTGTKRFKDLLVGLCGIGTNLLAALLKDLEAQGLVCRTTLPPDRPPNAHYQRVAHGERAGVLASLGFRPSTSVEGIAMFKAARVLV